ncbi:DUF2577 domain-containing protein [Brevibacillus sp. SYP-B805]|uniref:DUF2577 domain-containing protein n=1 Tax=Brevibacillus sp. SYP-B805 TaxID=1578199 RepID=UPI0032179AEB
MPRNLERYEGTGISQLEQWIKDVGYNDFDKLYLATVTSVPPNLKVKIDNWPIELEADDLIVAEHLTRHTRIVTITHDEGTSRDVGDMNPKPTDHDSEGDLYFRTEYLELKFEDVLKEGDRVLVASMNEGQTYVILDRVVRYSDGS